MASKTYSERVNIIKCVRAAKGWPFAPVVKRPNGSIHWDHSIGYQGQTEAIQQAAPKVLATTCRRVTFMHYVHELQKKKNRSKFSGITDGHADCMATIVRLVSAQAI